MKKLILMRAPSGSGKSRLAQELGKGGLVVGSDDYFINDKGEYAFDASRKLDAYRWVQQKAEEAMQNGVTPVVIDNTNTQAKFMKPYVLMAQKYGYQVEFAEPTWHPNLKTPDGKWNADFINEMQKERLKTDPTKVIPQDRINSMINEFEYGVTVDDILKASLNWYQKLRLA